MRRSGDEGDREHDHDHRRLGERGDHDLAAGADAAEAGSGIECCDGLDKACRAEQCDDGDQVAGPTEQKAGLKGRDERRRNPGGGEDQVGRHAEEPRAIVGENDILAEQTPQVAIGLKDRRADPALQPGLHLAGHAGQRRGKRQYQQHLPELGGECGRSSP